MEFNIYHIKPRKFYKITEYRIIPNGDIDVSIVIEGIENDWKRGWTFNGIQIL